MMWTCIGHEICTDMMSNSYQVYVHIMSTSCPQYVMSENYSSSGMYYSFNTNVVGVCKTHSPPKIQLYFISFKLCECLALLWAGPLILKEAIVYQHTSLSLLISIKGM